MSRPITDFDRLLAAGAQAAQRGLDQDRAMRGAGTEAEAARKLGRVADALVGGLTDITDEELLAEAREDGEEPQALARQAKEIISAAVTGDRP